MVFSCGWCHFRAPREAAVGCLTGVGSPQKWRFGRGRPSKKPKSCHLARGFLQSMFIYKSIRNKAQAEKLSFDLRHPSKCISLDSFTQTHSLTRHGAFVWEWCHFRAPKKGRNRVLHGGRFASNVVVWQRASFKIARIMDGQSLDRRTPSSFPFSMCVRLSV